MPGSCHSCACGTSAMPGAQAEPRSEGSGSGEGSGEGSFSPPCSALGSWPSAERRSGKKTWTRAAAVFSWPASRPNT